MLACSEEVCVGVASGAGGAGVACCGDVGVLAVLAVALVGVPRVSVGAGRRLALPPGAIRSSAA